METKFLDNISVSQIGRAVILVVIFKTDLKGNHHPNTLTVKFDLNWLCGSWQDFGKNRHHLQNERNLKKKANFERKTKNLCIIIALLHFYSCQSFL
jgi:hypothetical protein